MFNIQKLELLEIEPIFPDNVDINLALKNYCIFGQKDEINYIILSQTEYLLGINFLSKIDINYPWIFVSESEYERLYHKCLEIKQDKEISNVSKNGDEILDEEISLVEFLRNSSDLLTSEESAPIIKFVNSLFFQAIKKGASDIHIEVHEKRGEVKFRIDGALVRHIELDKSIITLITSRIKVISNLDISEKRLPQDGRTQVKIAGKSLDVRVSIFPTYYGERVVMRILMQSHSIPSLMELGFEEQLTNDFDELLKHSHGMILVTGPTGSGKSTTLHSFLQVLASPEKNIITIEDPVEYIADNLNQNQVNPKIGLTFASGLRSILRQDPDIIMLGEIRDAETAEIAVKSALTGHLVLSTLHTNNATSAITRLADMGVDSFLISSSVLGVLAQRLVRKLCPHCKLQTTITQEQSQTFELPYLANVYKQCGCLHCSNTGYKGRQSIGELFLVDDSVKSLLKKTTDDFDIRSFMKNKGMRFLSDQLKDLLLDGTTSLDEIIRVGIKDA